VGIVDSRFTPGWALVYAASMVSMCEPSPPLSRFQ
jgi:hypothetical protein